THPSDRDRLSNVAGEEGSAGFRSEGPATVLFRDFAALCRTVTLASYTEHLGEHVSERNLVPTRQFLAARSASREEQNAGKRYCRGFSAAARPLLLDSRGPCGPQDPLLARQRLIEARRRFDEVAPRGVEALREYETGEKRRLEAVQAERLLAAGLPI